MDPLETVEIGTTGLRVTRLGLGGAPLGSQYSETGRDKAVQIIRRALELCISYFDTAPLYGQGTSERYFQRGLAGTSRRDFVLSTKVGRLLKPATGAGDTQREDGPPPVDVVYDYSRDGVLRSVEESLERLGLDRVDIALVHDPDEGEGLTAQAPGEPVHFRQVLEEAYPALAELRSQGVVKAIGVGMNQWQALARFARDCDFDCFLLAGRYTLLDHSGLAELLPLCEEKRISIVLGGPYNSGVLASDLSPGATYFYSQVPPEVLERARSIKSVCDRHDVPLKAAALQFGLAHPAVAATIPGAVSAAEVEDNLSMTAVSIPPDLWSELASEGLIPSHAPTPPAE